MTCKTPKETSAVVSSLIIDTFHYENDKDDLNTQLTTYLTLVGVENDDILVFMSESMWPTPASLSRTDINLLTVPVLSLLNKIARFIAHVRESSFYLTYSITYNELAHYAS